MVSERDRHSAQTRVRASQRTNNGLVPVCLVCQILTDCGYPLVYKTGRVRACSGYFVCVCACVCVCVCVCVCCQLDWSTPASFTGSTPRVVPMGEASVIIAISSEHRRESLEGVQCAIDTLKTSVPIWKKVSTGRWWRCCGRSPVIATVMLN